MKKKEPFIRAELKLQNIEWGDCEGQTAFGRKVVRLWTAPIRKKEDAFESSKSDFSKLLASDDYFHKRKATNRNISV
jgi:hypothetical protein